MMRLATAPITHGHHLTRADLWARIKQLRAANNTFVHPHHSLVAGWFYDVLNFVVTWFPVFLVAVLAVVAWLLWRVAGSMPRTKPQNMATKGSSTTTWDDVTGVEGVRAQLMAVVKVLR